jgi:hypothetical protein
MNRQQSPESIGMRVQQAPFDNSEGGLLARMHAQTWLACNAKLAS